jgi:hypothetical protein
MELQEGLAIDQQGGMYVRCPQVTQSLAISSERTRRENRRSPTDLVASPSLMARRTT